MNFKDKTIVITGASSGIGYALAYEFASRGARIVMGARSEDKLRSIAEDQGVKMPSFFGYMLWSVGILFPCFALITYLFFM